MSCAPNAFQAHWIPCTIKRAVTGRGDRNNIMQAVTRVGIIAEFDGAFPPHAKTNEALEHSS